MPKVVTGDYLIQYYDQYGSCLKNLTETSLTIVSAKANGAKELDRGEALSFTIDKRMYNSLDLPYMKYAPETD